MELTAVCDTNADRLQQIAREFAVPHATTSWEETCESDLDIMSICTPDHLHHRMAKRALEAGKHVMCEKPMTTGLEDALDLVRTVRATGRQLAVGNVNRYEPQFRAVKQMVADGRLGELFMVEADYIHDMRRVYPRTPWRIDPEQPQNAWYGGAVHPMDLVRWLAGDVDEIMLYQSKCASTPGFPLPDNYVSVLRFGNGCLGRVWETSGIRRWPEHVVHLNAYGSEGTVLADTESHTSTAWLDPHIADQEGPARTQFRRLREHPVLEELRDFVECLRSGRPPLVDVVEGAKTIGTLAAGLRSVESGRPEKVPPLE